MHPRGGGLWLRMILPPGLSTLLVPSGYTRQRPAQFVQHHALVPMAVVLQSGQAGSPAAGPGPPPRLADAVALAWRRAGGTIRSCGCGFLQRRATLEHPGVLRSAGLLWIVLVLAPLWFVADLGQSGVCLAEQADGT